MGVVKNVATTTIGGRVVFTSYRVVLMDDYQMVLGVVHVEGKVCLYHLLIYFDQ